MLLAASEEIPQTASFTIEFAEKDFNETPIAASVAELLSSPHHRMLYDEDKFVAEYLLRQKHLDEPYASVVRCANSSIGSFY